MPKQICGKCGQAFGIIQNGVNCIEYRNIEKTNPVAIWAGDVYVCVVCDGRLVVTARQPYIESHHEDFESVLNGLRAETRIEFY